MTGRLVVGIDPGNLGALAFVDPDGSILSIVDMPCIEDGTKGRRTVNAPILAAILREYAPAHAFIELINARPTDAKVAARAGVALATAKAYAELNRFGGAR